MAGVLILMRHGQSQWNRENRFTGWADVPLSPQGEVEARAAAEKLRPYRFDRAYSSELSRTRVTLRIILSVLGQGDIPVEHVRALNGRHYGLLEGLDKAETIRQFGAEQVHLWRRSYEIAPPGGESLQEAQERVLAYYHAEIEPCLKRGEAILIVSHGNTLRALVMALEGLTPADVERLEIPTAAPRLYHIDAAGRVLNHGDL